MSQKNILFVCGHNAGRSQMAEAYFNHINTNAQYIAVSCGTHPADSIHPHVKKILEHSEISDDIIEKLYPKMITPELEKNAEKIFTMGCGVDCRIFSSTKPVVDLGIADPHGKNLGDNQKIFIQIQEYIEDIVRNVETN